MSDLSVYIDNREQNRVDKGKEYYRKHGFDVTVTTLKYGDYCFWDKETSIGVAFEFKTHDDFINSLTDNRVFNQALNQSNTYDYHFVIIVGEDKNKAIRKKGYFTGNYLSMESWNGAIASLVEFTSVLFAENDSWAFDLMGRVAEKCTRDRPIIHRYPKSKGSPAFRILTNFVSGVNVKTAERICKVCGLRSVDSLLGVGVDDLKRVDGIGDKRAVGIVSQLRDLV
ncbi:ERCC4 domain-containing protein [Methanobrevibacter sp.]